MTERKDTDVEQLFAELENDDANLRLAAALGIDADRRTRGSNPFTHVSGLYTLPDLRLSFGGTKK